MSDMNKVFELTVLAMHDPEEMVREVMIIPPNRHSEVMIGMLALICPLIQALAAHRNETTDQFFAGIAMAYAADELR